MRVIFAIFLAILLFQGPVTAGRAARRRRRMEARRLEVARQITCSSTAFDMKISKNTCPNIDVWAPHQNVDLLEQYKKYCDPLCKQPVIRYYIPFTFSITFIMCIFVNNYIKRILHI